MLLELALGGFILVIVGVCVGYRIYHKVSGKTGCESAPRHHGCRHNERCIFKKLFGRIPF